MKRDDTVYIRATVLEDPRADGSVWVRIQYPWTSNPSSSFIVPQDQVLTLDGSGTLDLSTYTAEEGYYPHD